MMFFGINVCEKNSVRIMTMIASLAVWLTVRAMFAAECPDPVTCSCGNQGETVTVCVPATDKAEVCSRLSKCEACEDGLSFCTKCPKGLQGPTCSRETSHETRQKRQSTRRRPSRRNRISYCDYNTEMSKGKAFYFHPSLLLFNDSRDSLDFETGKYPEGSLLMYRCNEGYLFSDAHQLKCVAGSWTPNPPICTPDTRSCYNLESPMFGKKTCIFGEKQTFCTGKCNPGYFFVGSNSKDEMNLTCIGGVWTPRTSFPNCRSVSLNETLYCNDLEPIPNGIAEYFVHDSWVMYIAKKREDFENGKIPEDTQVNYHCNEGFQLRGSDRLVCVAGIWSSPPPTCAPTGRSNYCNSIGHVPNGRARYFYPPSWLFDDSRKDEDFKTGKYPEGTVIEYYCDEMFVGQNADKMICKAGVWSLAGSICVPDSRNCISLKSPKFGTMECFPGGRRTICTGKCDPGYIFDDTRSRNELNLTCWWGDWRPLPAFPNCKLSEETTTCRDPGFIENGIRRNPDNSESMTNETFEEGQSVFYSCKNSEEFSLRGSPLLTCKQDGNWSSPLPVCLSLRIIAEPEIDYCENPGIISNGQVVYFPTNSNRRLLTPLDEQEFPERSRLEYSCDAGYMLVGRTTLICEKPGFWSSDPPFCRRDTSRRRYCMYPGNVVNGRVEYIPVLTQWGQPLSSSERDEYPEGSRLRYSCEEGYTLEGPALLTCKSSGSWSPAVPPTCINADDIDRATCENPGRVLNGRVWYFAPDVRNGPGVRLDNEMDEYPEGSALEYYCDRGFWLQGSHSLMCDSMGFWSAERPTCVGDCGRSFVQTDVRIRDGQETMTGEWPWAVSISLQEENGTRFVCGGAVVNTRFVVTAAHCLEEGRTYILRFGKHHFRIEDDDSKVLVRTSSRVIIHPDYSRRTLDSDIGLIQLQSPIEYSTRVQPICMPTIETTIRNIRTGSLGYVSGWGDTELDLPSDSLLFAGLPVLSMQTCVESYMRQNLTVSISGNMFCAGYPNGTYSVCGGDSGSPFVFYDNLSKRFTLEGLVSFVVRRRQDAQACGWPGRYAIFMRVFRFVPWMYEIIE